MSEEPADIDIDIAIDIDGPANPVSNIPSNHLNLEDLLMDSIGLMVEDGDGGRMGGCSTNNSITSSTDNMSSSSSSPSSSSKSSSFSHYLASLKDRIGDLCESKNFSDVTFKVGANDDEEPEEFNGHKLILAISSPVFAAMFYGSMKSENVVSIPDCKPEAFRILLQFAYKSELSIMEVQLALDVLYAARKYSMRLLEDECMVYLCGNVSFESVLAVKEAAETYDLPVLAAICKEYIEDNSYDVLKHHFPFLNLDMLLHFIQNDRLNIQEIDLFLILAEWANQECDRRKMTVNADNARKIIEPCLSHMRFPTMDASDFADHVVPTGILTTDEVAKVLTYISATDKGKHAALPFPIAKRIAKPSKVIEISAPESSNDRINVIGHSTRRHSRNHGRKRSRNQ